MIDIKNNIPDFLVIDLFCGAGGATTGFLKALVNGKCPYKVIGCVNHDPLAIQSHWANHPEVEHHEEDIRTLKLDKLLATLTYWRKKYPKAKLILWASPDCTHHSKAKGGMPREADSRTLAAHLYRYIRILAPDYIMIENVAEFKDWGPLDENQKPIKHLKGIHFERWRSFIRSWFKYSDEWRMMCSADFGGRTTRTRLFGIFSKITDGKRLPIAWPEPTHSKNPEKTGLKKWLPVRDVLQLDDHGYSILNRSRNKYLPKNRQKEIVDATLERIYAGLLKHVKPEIDQFMMMNYSGDPKHKNFSLEQPGRTVTTIDHHKLISSEFLATYNKSPVIRDLQQPCPTVTTKDRFGLTEVQWMDLQFGSGQKEKAITEPSNAVLPVPKMNLVTAHHMDKQYGGKDNHHSLDHPGGSLTTNPKLSLVETAFLMPTNFDNKPISLEYPSPVITADRHHHYIVDCQFNNKGRSIDKPAQTLIAKMDKKPPYLVTTQCGNVAIQVFEDDSYMTRKIKQFMAENGIVDIKMRMLNIPELLQIQGFPKDYKLAGPDEKKKKWIGNSVEVNYAKCWAEAMAIKLKPKKQTVRCNTEKQRISPR